MLRALAFVDLETTGASAVKDRITEIGVVLVDADGVREWSRLINPQARIPGFIEQLTGISNEMVSDAPLFAEVADELRELLRNRLFIAHNARFDYGFLKNEFQRLGMNFQANVLCTVKLSRRLFPEFHQHNLDSLIARHQFSVGRRHRALADAQVLHQFWAMIGGRFSAEHLEQQVNRLISRSSLPPHIDADLPYTLPEGPGVYMFYGENDLPLYIGKSVNLRQRVLAHFAADYRSNKEMNLSLQVRRVTWRECGGEIGALLLEARLIKELSPVFNQRLRRKNALCAWRLQANGEGLSPVLQWAGELGFGGQSQLYGLYHSAREAQKSLRALAEEHALCLAALGLEHTSPGRPCFAYQLKSCRGACVGAEAASVHAERLLAALSEVKLAVWPYPGPVAIREGDDWLVLDNWCFMGVAHSELEAEALLRSGQPGFDRDTFRTLAKALSKAKVTPLIRRESMSGESVGPGAWVEPSAANFPAAEV